MRQICKGCNSQVALPSAPVGLSAQVVPSQARLAFEMLLADLASQLRVCLRPSLLCIAVSQSAPWFLEVVAPAHRTVRFATEDWRHLAPQCA